MLFEYSLHNMPIKGINPGEVSPEWSVNSGGRFPLQVWFIVGILHQITEVFVTNTSILCVPQKTVGECW